MARGTIRIGAMLLHPVTERASQRFLAFFEFRDIRRGRRRRSAENIIEHPFAALNWRGASGIGSNRQDAALCEQASTVIAFEADLPKLFSLDAVDPVMMRKLLVQERVIRVDKLQHAAVFPADELEKKLGFLLHRCAQALIESGELFSIRCLE